MRAHIKASLLLFVLLSILSFCTSQNQVNAQDFLKKLLSNSSLKKGKQLKADGDYASAITAFTKSIKKEPENLEAYYQLGLIFEEAMHNYDKAISMYKQVTVLSEGLRPTGTDEELEEFNTLITNARKSIDRATLKKFESIEKPKVPVYIIVKSYKKVFKEPKKHSYGIYKTTSHANKFRLLNFNDNWYQINVPSTGLGWIRGKDVLKIIRKEKEAVEISLAGKAAQYERFVDLYPDSRFASDARERADSIYYELAKKENTINGYSAYLRRYPDGKHAEEIKSKVEVLMFQDEGFFNNIDRLKSWVHNNPESTFLAKAKTRLEGLMFAQAKFDKNIIALERYTAEYPKGKFIAEANQMIEDLKYEQARLADTLDSYRKYLNEYPNGKYVEDATKRADEKEFSTLLKRKDIELLSEHLKNETNKERVELVRNRIEELYYKKAHETGNIAGTIKMYEDYLQKYPDGLYAQEAKTRIEELSFDSVKKAGTVAAYEEFIRKYPKSKYAGEVMLRVDKLNYEKYLKEDTLDAYKKFVIKYPENRYVSEAREEISQRLPAKEPRTRKSGIPIGLIIFVFGIGLIVLFVLKSKQIITKKQRIGRKSKVKQKDAKQVLEELFGDSELKDNHNGEKS